MSKLLDIFNKHSLQAPFSRTECIAEIIGDEGAIDELNEKTDFLCELEFKNIAMQCRCLTYTHGPAFPLNLCNRAYAEEAIGRHFLMVLEKAASDYINMLRDAITDSSDGGFELMQMDADEIADVLYEGPDDEELPENWTGTICNACNKPCDVNEQTCSMYDEFGNPLGRAVRSGSSACCGAGYRMRVPT